jgi:alkylhydroperoxidase/carboxymuconolactone decarboxylase family protein YurZ
MADPLREPWHDLLETETPEIAAAYASWRKARQHFVLERKVQEFIILVLDAADAWPSPYIDRHVRNALANGASLRELVDVVMLAGQIKGAHAFAHGMRAIARVAAEGKPDSTADGATNERD